MSEAPENIKHWSGCDPADGGYCPDCGEHLDYGRCRCEPEEHCPNMTVTEFKERIKTICGIRPGKPEPPFPNDMERDELRRWIRYAGWEMFEPDEWWNYRHMVNMKTGGIIPEPPNRVLQRLAAKTKRRLIKEAK